MSIEYTCDRPGCEKKGAAVNASSGTMCCVVSPPGWHTRKLMGLWFEFCSKPCVMKFKADNKERILRYRDRP